MLNTQSKLLSQRPLHHPRGFTLLEMIVVVLLLVLLAGFMMPRLVGAERRRTELVVDKFEDMLAMFAHRDSLNMQSVGLWYDAPNRTVYLMAMQRDPDDAAARPDWRIDRLVEPLHLPPEDELPIFVARTDGKRTAQWDWMLTSRPGRPRPALSFEIGTREYVTELILEPDSITPARLDATNTNLTRTRYDLDDSGKTRQDW